MTFWHKRRGRRRARRITRRVRNAPHSSFQKARLPFKRRLHYEKLNYNTSNWALMLMAGRCKSPISRDGRLFRRRFRVPYPIFQQIVSLTREKMWYKETDGIGRPSAPLELKILGVLRVLGRGMCFDGIAELTNISEEAIRIFFHSFCKNFSTELFSTYCKSPETDEEIKKVTNVYERLGLPGCVGSTDCVHILTLNSLHNIIVTRLTYIT